MGKVRRPVLSLKKNDTDNLTMKTSHWVTILRNTLKTPPLRNVLLASLIIAMVFPVYSIFFVYPSFSKLVIETAEIDAIRAATYLKPVIVTQDNELIMDSPADNLINEIERVIRDFQLDQIKIYSTFGGLVYSSNPKDLETINLSGEFREVLAKGGVFTRVVEKGTKTLEGRVVTSDVVETYVPLMKDDKLIGAFEIYYDITTGKQKLEKLLSRSIVVLLVIALSLLIATIMILFKASQTSIERQRAEVALREAHDELERRVEERTAELSESNALLEKEIAERERVEDALRKSEEDLRHLSSQLLEVQEKERKRIGIELHDTVVQTLVAIKVRLEGTLIGTKNDKPPSDIPLEDIISMVQKEIDEVRRIIIELRPSVLDDLGILAAIEWFCREYQTPHPRVRIEKQFNVRETEIPDSLRIVIYRVMQEALENAARHSTADKVKISLERVDGRVQLSIEDNGEGFNVEAVRSRSGVTRGLGLSSMRERVGFSNGSLFIESTRGKGTVVQASWSY